MPSTAATGTTETIRETLDSLVIAFILAVVFRAFVVEAFIIPTGSMAPTLYGEHGSVVCQDCGYSFAYGLYWGTHRVERVRADSTAVCPNCRYPNTSLKFTDSSRRTESGDRILVLKWPLDIGGPGLDLARWDVVVFKDPKDIGTNFIKRLVGMPGDVLCILDGDVYTVPESELSDSTRQALEAQLQRKIQLQHAPQPGAGLSRLPDEVFDELNAKLRILRKTELAQKSLWFPVYNDDFRPRLSRSRRSVPDWTPLSSTTGWDLSERTWRFTPRENEESDAVELRGIRLTDDYGYNLGSEGIYPVEDMRVSLLMTPQSASASMSITLTRFDHQWTAQIGPENRVRLTGRYQGKPIPASDRLSAEIPDFREGMPCTIVFQIVDYRASLRLNGREILATTDDLFAPDPAQIRQRLPRRIRDQSAPPRIVAAGGALTVEHVNVERDIYYQAPDPDGHVFGRYDFKLARRIGVWGGPDNPILLRSGEYFCMGDNSPESQDSRLWTEIGSHLVARRNPEYQLGTVLADQMVGRAFFVYWPAGHRLGDWLPVFGQFGIIPNVGSMRWIR